MEVLYEGYLEKCLNPDESKREWKKRYFVLKKSLGSGTQTFEYYKEKEWRKQEPKGVLTLFSGYQVDKVHDPKKRHTFEVKTIDSFFLLATATDESRDRWIEALRHESAGKLFNVTVEESHKTKELGITDEPCTLQITSSSVLLILGSSPAISWPFNCIRRYKCHPGIFLLEVGRKAPTGEGIFRFFTQEGQDIFEILGKAVATRMSSKQGNENQIQTDLAAGLASQMKLNPEGNIGNQVHNQNLFIDAASRQDNIRFVMKQRSASSSPPPSPLPMSSKPQFPPVEDNADDYSHLKFSQKDRRTPSDADDYDQLARAKDCNRFNQTRKSDSRHPSVSSNKALKVLGLIRSNSADSLPRSQNSDNSTESSDSYAHLEFNKQKIPKSQSSSNVLIDELKDAAANFHRRPDIAASDKQDEDDVFQPNIDNLYNKLRSDRKEITGRAIDDNDYSILNESMNKKQFSSSPMNVDDTYDRLESNQGTAHHKPPRPEPIIMDDTYDALIFAGDKIVKGHAINDSNQSTSQMSSAAVSSNETSALMSNAASKPNAEMKSNLIRPQAPKPDLVAPKPLVAKKPPPSKPPRKIPPPGLSENRSVNDCSSSVMVSGEPSQERPVADVKNNLISQLKKNLEGQGFTPVKTSSPLTSPPSSSKKLNQPLYAVSPFTSGNTAQVFPNDKKAAVPPSDYDVPSQIPVSSPPSSSENKHGGFVYAVSPFHAVNQKSVQNSEQNLYDTPTQNHSNYEVQNLYDSPVQYSGNVDEENLYDTPVPQNEYDIVRNIAPAPSSAKENVQAHQKQFQFMYAVSPFASGQNQRDMNELNQYDTVGKAVKGSPYEEASYCEIRNLLGGGKPPSGYAEVGETFSPGELSNESIYSVPRDERR